MAAAGVQLLEELRTPLTRLVRPLTTPARHSAGFQVLCKAELRTRLTCLVRPPEAPATCNAKYDLLCESEMLTCYVRLVLPPARSDLGSWNAHFRRCLLILGAVHMTLVAREWVHGQWCDTFMPRGPWCRACPETVA